MIKQWNATNCIIKSSGKKSDKHNQVTFADVNDLPFSIDSNWGREREKTTTTWLDEYD